MSTTGEIIRKILYWATVVNDNQVELYHLITSLIQYSPHVPWHEVISRQHAELPLGGGETLATWGAVQSYLLV